MGTLDEKMTKRRKVIKMREKRQKLRKVTTKRL